MNFRRLVFVVVLFGVFACGQNDPGPPTNPQAGEPTASFSWIFENIVQNQCLRCHDGPAFPKSVNLNSYETLVNNPKTPNLVVPNEPDQSQFYLSMANGSMPKKWRRH